ncbi:TniQ family protein [Streptomyces sp. NPDC005407]|uniref:TniQ family protein n=1 Tax=Streptomyces sp. NPDC005407 TaxID=3155340 RepID=UPI0033BA344F
MTDQRLPSRLPIDVRPHHGESIDSYIDRLALANHLKPADLRIHLRPPPRHTGRLSLERLAAVSGRDASLLRRILGRGRCIGCDGHLIVSQITAQVTGRSARWCSQRCREAARLRRDPRQAPELWPPSTSNCRQCGEHLGSDNDLRWCSSICQNAFFRGFRRQDCGICGAPLPAASRGRPPKWCSTHCRRAAYEQRRVEQRQRTQP